METKDVKKELSDYAIILQSYDRDIASLKSLFFLLQTTAVEYLNTISENMDVYVQNIAVCSNFATLLMESLDDAFKAISDNLKSYNKEIMKEQPKSEKDGI